MRDYSKIQAGFWTGRTGKELRRHGLEVRVVAAYLISSPHANSLGLYHLPLAYIAGDTGVEADKVLSALGVLSDVGFCSYDQASETVWVHEMARYQIAERLKERDLQAEGVRREYRNLPESPFVGAFYDRYAEAFHIHERRDSGLVSVGVGAECRASQAQGGNVALVRRSEPAPAQEVVAVGQTHSLDLGDASQQVGKVVPLNARALVVPKSVVAECPHAEIVALYHELLPSCLPVRAWPERRQAYLRQRWREDPKRQNLGWWRRFFQYVGQSTFLTGKSPAKEGKPFVADLEWLLKPTNFLKVIEGRYHPATD